MQRQLRAQEKKRKLLADLHGVEVCVQQQSDGIEAGRFAGKPCTMEDIAGRAGDVGYDAEDTQSSRPLSFTSSAIMTTGSMSLSVEYVPGAEASSYNDHQGHASPGAYNAALGLPYTQPVSPIAGPSSSPLTRILARGFSIFEPAPKTSAGKVSWGNRVGRKIRAYGRQIIGQA